MAPGTLLGSLSFVEGSSSAVLMALMSYSPKHVSNIAALEKRHWHMTHRSQVDRKCLILPFKPIALGQLTRLHLECLCLKSSALCTGWKDAQILK